MERIVAIKRGDTRAFADMFEITYRKTFSFFMARTNGNREISKELTQLTYIKVWNSKHTLSESHSLDKQLFIITKCILIDFIRKEASERSRKNELCKGSLPVNHSGKQDLSFESNDYVFSLLKLLPPARKKILQMKFVYGYTNREIATLLSVSVKTVEDHVTKGLHELRTNTKLSEAFFLIVFISCFL